MKVLHRRQILASLSAAAVGAVVPTGSILSRSPATGREASRKSSLRRSVTSLSYCSTLKPSIAKQAESTHLL